MLRSRQKWSTTDVEKLRRMVKAHCTFSEISKDLHRTPLAIHTKASRLGLRVKGSLYLGEAALPDSFISEKPGSAMPTLLN